MRGGARKGAGRKRGIAHTRTREIADGAAAAGITPLEFMLTLLRKPLPDGADAAVQSQHDSLRFEAAKAAAPYLHPRLAPRDATIQIAMSGTLAEQGRAVIKQMAAGAVSPDQAAKVMGTLAAQARIVEIDELERRVRLLEEAAPKKASLR
jgi:hypothetical protein